ncbi:hypothetical protein CP532_6698, partial [Ophiocordyceps camponoti-leonardi (nom. inval.)]
QLFPRCSVALLSKISTSLLRPPASRALSTSLSLRLSRSSPRFEDPKSHDDPTAWLRSIKIDDQQAANPSPSAYNPNQQFWSNSEPSSKPPTADPLTTWRRSTSTPPPPPPPAADTYGDKQDTPSSGTPDYPYNTNDHINVHHAVEEMYRESVPVVIDPRQTPKIHTKAVTGRTIFIIPRRSGPNTAPTVASAFRALNRLVQEQKLRQKSHFQKIHLRPGLKRKMLKSKRWRARFKVGFKAAAFRALELKKQGW